MLQISLTQGHLRYYTFIPSVPCTGRLYTILKSFPSQHPKDTLSHLSHALGSYIPSHPTVTRTLGHSTLSHLSQGHLGYPTIISSVPITGRLQSYYPSHPTVPRTLVIPHLSYPSRLLGGFNPTIHPIPLSQGSLGYHTFIPSVLCTGSLYAILLSFPSQ